MKAAIETHDEQNKLRLRNAAEYRMAIAVLMVAVPGRQEPV